ncbi:IS256 family transposase [Leptolyngbya sp. FACHB-541]|uniref:IS256 family transposase n=1 Tax=Leptolyngbya sp. FACHB-541 TaxID=2692810 RepID=UPI0016873ACF|nr:IS256 family transposase [Leptolyngbya sp. FACHB-541]MBD1997226.1 IS256 family transposase [Leptolyngbya sp. FACHB-541]
MTFRPELLDELLKGYENPEDLLGDGGILKQLTAALVERCLNAEMKTHLEAQQAETASGDKPTRNRRNGHSKKTIKGEFGAAQINVPRDRNSEFEPIIVKKGQSRFDGFDDKILSLYARGMSTRDIQAQLQDLYGVEVSAGLISNVTDAVEAERKLWQNRALDPVYPIVYFDALVVKVRQDGRVINKAIHLALGVNLSGTKELLGIWMSQNESAKFWLAVLTELQNRGLKDIFIACCDGLTGFPDAIEAVFPKTQVQLCIVHMVRNSLGYVSYKDRKAVAADLRLIYTASTESEAEQHLVAFAEKWDKQYPTISKSWLNHWQRIIPFFAFPAEIRKAIYTTNAIESMNMTLRKVLKNRRAFPTDESALKVVYLAIQNISKKWTMPIRDWRPALNQFAIAYEDRFPL